VDSGSAREVESAFGTVRRLHGEGLCAGIDPVHRAFNGADHILRGEDS
jgi:hypothetical protein